MRNLLLTTCLGAVAALAAGAAQANDELIKMSQNPKDWVMPTGNYANQRYSQLKQIAADNVGKLQVAWTFSTGVLRGHEGGPLIIGDVMYVHGPFPNPVYALDLKNESKILWKYEPKQDPNVIPVMCCDTVNRGLSYADGKIFLHQADTTLVALNAKDGKVVWQQKNGDPAKGETGTSAPMVIKDKVLVGISGGEFGVQCHVTAYDLKSGRPDSVRPGQDHRARQAGRQGLEREDLARRSVEDRRRLHLGLDLVRSSVEPVLLRLGQSFDLESEPAARRQQVVDDDLRA
jgi:PQQ-dependent dehydrogenase (methanol/ethanol family)